LTSLWQEKAGFLSKRERKKPSPSPTVEPFTNKRKQVCIADGEQNRKRSRPPETAASEGEEVNQMQDDNYAIIEG
jgi:hypothetical protein